MQRKDEKNTIKMKLKENMFLDDKNKLCFRRLCFNHPYYNVMQVDNFPLDNSRQWRGSAETQIPV